MKCAKMNDHFHRMGQMNYEDSRRIWVAEGFYPSAITSTSESSSAVSSTIEINRGDDWYCSMHKKDKRTGVRSIPSEKTKSVATKYVSIIKFLVSNVGRNIDDKNFFPLFIV
jgi:hypothetical protein